ncbi:MAG: hypothetical protein QXP38_06825, partial [Nitrososphaerota archaeon]
LPKEEQAASKPLIWHADYHLNYLTLYPGAQGLGGEFTYSGSGGENSGVSVVYNGVFSPPPERLWAQYW